MKYFPRIVLLLAASALGIWLWLTLFPPPEKVIANEFRDLAKAVTVRPGEGALPRMLGAQKAGGFFSTSVEINIELPNHHQQTTLTRDEIVQAVATGPGNGSLMVKFPDINVTIGADKETAQADVTLEARITGEQDMIVQEMRFTLRKTDGKWLITRAQTVRTFSQ